MAANASAKHADQVVFTFDEDVSVVDSAVSSHRRAEKSRGIMAKATGNVGMIVFSRHCLLFAAAAAILVRRVLSGTSQSWPHAWPRSNAPCCPPKLQKLPFGMPKWPQSCECSSSHFLTPPFTDGIARLFFSVCCPNSFPNSSVVPLGLVFCEKCDDLLVVC